MSTTGASTETSVTFSLAELAKIEQERVREEDERRARMREQETRARIEAEARRRQQELADLEAQEQARAKRLREAAEEQARNDAREKAAMEVARIEAAAKARLDEENARRAHELALLKVRTETGSRRLVIALGAALGLSLIGGGVTATFMGRSVDRMTAETMELKDRLQALAKEREQAKATELSALDRRFATLKERARGKDAVEALVAAEAARNRLDLKALDHDRLRGYADAIDAYAARIDVLERLELIDRRQADLAAWAAERRRGELATEARSAAAKAKLLATADSVRAYESALDHVRGELAQAGGRAGRAASAGEPVAASGKTCLPGDPGCGLDGKPLF
jgi:hypothetical protein